MDNNILHKINQESKETKDNHIEIPESKNNLVKYDQKGDVGLVINTNFQVQNNNIPLYSNSSINDQVLTPKNKDERKDDVVIKMSPTKVEILIKQNLFN